MHLAHALTVLGPWQIDHYKGLGDHAIYKPHSEHAALLAGLHTRMFNTSTIALVKQRLDLKLEAALGYQYTDDDARAPTKQSMRPVRKTRWWN